MPDHKLLADVGLCDQNINGNDMFEHRKLCYVKDVPYGFTILGEDGKRKSVVVQNGIVTDYVPVMAQTVIHQVVPGVPVVKE